MQTEHSLIQSILFLIILFIPLQSNAQTTGNVVPVSAPAETLWQALLDIESTAALVPGQSYHKKIHIINESEPLVAITEGRMNIPLFPAQYTLLVKFHEKNRRYEWRMLTDREADSLNTEGVRIRKSSGFIKDIHGFAYIEPSGELSLLHLNSVVESTIPLPDFVEKSIEKATITDYMMAVKKLAEKIHTESLQQLPSSRKEDNRRAEPALDKNSPEQ